MLKQSERGTILLLRDRHTGQRRVCRQFQGDGSAYAAMLGLSSPYLPGIEAVAEEDGQVLVLEEYIQGDSLAFLLEGGPLPTEYARDIALQVCRALEILHGLGIVHRDIKPENIIIRGDTAVVIDFDASRTYKSEMPSDTRIMGTTGYAAPEQYGFSQTDARADIYSLGILLNEMLTLRHPATCLAQGPLLPVIEKCVEVNIHNRYQSATMVIAALEASAAPKKKVLPWLLLAVPAVFAAVLLWPRPAPVPVPTPTPAPSPIPASATAAPTPSPKVATSVISDSSVVEWIGPASGTLTPFTYDLDGDGTEESYVFGLASDLPHSGIGGGHDTRLVPPDRMSQLSIAPGVATFDGEQSVDTMPAFADLLENVTFTLYCADRQGSGVPDVWNVSNLDGVWPNTVLLQWGIEDIGVWIYEFTAELDGKTLTARGVSTIYPDTYDIPGK